MKLEQQVTSLELSKRLKELGVKQESHFYWFPQIGYVDETPVGEEDEESEIVERTVFSSKDEGWYLSCDPKEEMRPNIVSAFTVAELGEMLPEYILTKADEICSECATVIKKEVPQTPVFRSWKNTKSWGCQYDGMLWKHSEVANTEADARAKMLIYLLENKFIPNPTDNI